MSMLGRVYAHVCCQPVPERGPLCASPSATGISGYPSRTHFLCYKWGLWAEVLGRLGHQQTKLWLCSIN